MTLDQIRRLDNCLNNCVMAPRDAVAQIDADKLERWLEYAESQVYKPQRLKQLIRAAQNRIRQQPQQPIRKER